MARSAPGAMQAAVAHHQAGRLEDARRLYEQVLRGEPKNADAVQLLGLVFIERGMPEKGFQLLRRAVAYAPRSVEALNNLAVELCRAGRFDEAMPCFDRLLALGDVAADVHYNMGRALQELECPDAARAAYDRALALDPGHAGALSHGGQVLQLLGHDEAALARFDAVIAANPGNPEAHYNRGVTLQRLKRFGDAVDSYDRTLALRPDHAEALYNRGLALHALGRLDAALAAYDAALACRPDYAEALNNRGTVLHEAGRFDAAEQSFLAALSRRPDYADAYFNLGNTLRAKHDPRAALASYDAALALQPGHAGAQENRGSALLDLQRYSEAAQAFAGLLACEPERDSLRGRVLHARLQSCEWDGFEESSQDIAARIRAGQRMEIPFMGLAHLHDANLQLLCAAAYVADKHPPVPGERGWGGGEKIRLAYLSGDLREHAVTFLMAGIFERHDRERFEVFAISFRPPEDSATGRRIAAAFDRLVDVSGMTDGAVAALLRELGIDVAIDLMGHTAGSRTGILAHRPAPVQVQYLGYPGSMGAPYVDYIIADDFLVPPGAEAFYSETIARLACGFQANDDRRAADPTPTRAEALLPETGVVFCCFNNIYKLNPPIFDVWMRLLSAAPGSVLWLAVDDPATRARLGQEAAKRGVTPERLVFAPRVSYAAHLGRLKLADLFLDTLPFNAGATASDALWAGVPVITCAGEAFASRMAGSLLHACGMPELVTGGLAEYEALALRLALDDGERAAVRARLRDRVAASSLFDTDAICRHLEAAYAMMLERHRHGEAPDHLAVKI